MRVSGERHAPAALPPRKTFYQFYRRLGRPQNRSGRVRKISPSPKFEVRPAHPAASLMSPGCASEYAARRFLRNVGSYLRSYKASYSTRPCKCERNSIKWNMYVYLKYHALKTQRGMEIKFCAFFISTLKTSQWRENLNFFTPRVIKPSGRKQGELLFVKDWCWNPGLRVSGFVV